MHLGRRMSDPLFEYNENTTVVSVMTTPYPLGPMGKHNKLPGGRIPPPKPTVSLDATPIVVPILSCVICFPVLAFALICALRYRAERLRQRDHLKRLQGGCRSVTLEIPARGEKSSFYSKDSSSDPSVKGCLGAELSQAEPELTPPLLSAPSTSGLASRRSSNRRLSSTSHVKFMTTTAVLHGRAVTGIHGRFKSTGKSQKIFWDEHSSHVDCAQELERELSLTLNS